MLSRMSDVQQVRDDDFETAVIARSRQQPVLVDFWAPWCGPCRMVAPVVDEIAREYKGKLKVAKLDIDSHQAIPQKYGIRSIPTLLVFKGGKIVDKQVGAVPKSVLAQKLQAQMA